MTSLGVFPQLEREDNNNDLFNKGCCVDSQLITCFTRQGSIELVNTNIESFQTTKSIHSSLEENSICQNMNIQSS